MCQYGVLLLVFSLKDRVDNLDSMDSGISRMKRSGCFEFLGMYLLSLFGFV